MTATGVDSPPPPVCLVLSDALPCAAVPSPTGPTGTPYGADPVDDASTDDPLGPKVRSAATQLGSIIARLDPDRLTGADAAQLYGLLAGVERLAMAGKTLLAPRIDQSGVWRDSGHRTAAAMLADL